MSTTATFRCCHPVLLNIKGSPTISGITPCLIKGLGQKMVLSHPHHPMNNLRHDLAWPHPGFEVLWCYPILHYHHVLPPWFPFTPWHHSAKPCPCCEWNVRLVEIRELEVTVESIPAYWHHNPLEKNGAVDLDHFLNHFRAAKVGTNMLNAMYLWGIGLSC